MKKSIKNLEVNSIKNIKTVKGGNVTPPPSSGFKNIGYLGNGSDY